MYTYMSMEYPRVFLMPKASYRSDCLTPSKVKLYTFIPFIYYRVSIRSTNQIYDLSYSRMKRDTFCFMDNICSNSLLHKLKVKLIIISNLYYNYITCSALARKINFIIVNDSFIRRLIYNLPIKMSFITYIQKKRFAL